MSNIKVGDYVKLKEGYGDNNLIVKIMEIQGNSFTGLVMESGFYRIGSIKKNFCLGLFDKVTPNWS